jgi:copper chaperone NosL
MRVSLRHRILLALAALILLPVFVTPVWTISLTAPQYPEGMGMYIGVSEVWGHDEHDIQNINILNHYIGMKPIEPEGIPELDIFPPILMGIIAAGLLAAVIGRWWVMVTWLVIFFGLAVAGVVDFYLWNLDYGHNLDPTAPIKIPGMTYTPPLIGTKQLLNITASSYPHIGSLFLGVSLALGAFAVIAARRDRRKAPAGDAGGMSSDSGEPLAARTAAPVAALVAFAVLIASCGNPGSPVAGVEPAITENRMVYEESSDPFCGGSVEKVRWGGELTTTNGERYRFKSVECLAGYLLETGTPSSQIAEVRVVDFPDGWRLIPVGDARFLHTPNLASPASRGLNIMAISTDKLAASLQDAYAGRLMGWDEVMATVGEAWSLGPARN